MGRPGRRIAQASERMAASKWATALATESGEKPSNMPAKAAAGLVGDQAGEFRVHIPARMRRRPRQVSRRRFAIRRCRCRVGGEVAGEGVDDHELVDHPGEQLLQPV